MVRPKKDPSLRMDVDLRIPVTREQKELIHQAVFAEKMDFAAWARKVLVEEAEQQLKKKKKG